MKVTFRSPWITSETWWNCNALQGIGSIRGNTITHCLFEFKKISKGCTTPEMFCNAQCMWARISLVACPSLIIVFSATSWPVSISWPKITLEFRPWIAVRLFSSREVWYFPEPGFADFSFELPLLFVDEDLSGFFGVWCVGILLPIKILVEAVFLSVFKVSTKSNIWA